MVVQTATGFDGTAYEINRRCLFVDGELFRGPDGMADCREFAQHHSRVKMAEARGYNPGDRSWNEDRLEWTTRVVEPKRWWLRE